ncbi:Fur family ferric uptake transcriptional regulator [Mobilisporobacter senegalensis]|uniref:Fur family ferric uptake transcriptional regulator n=1 Tax=Mobilisporobacter senegalensis TaxID=1329262 RepID=A0A3N1X591_9FIRM|nr:transcriptional repressor [Mobilisporobacter senegalensis]ROR21940.1 Fur family ferric uptake transcriptional regulator [Mobilisporobacter senegalensis]
MEKEILKSVELKNTKKRQIILSILEKAHKPLTAEEIYAQTIGQTRMSFSTVYRSLGALTEKQILMKELMQDGKTYYQFNNNNHKHLLVCSICGEIIPIDDCPLHKLENDLVSKTGYIITGHSLEFNGICPKCTEKF